MAPTNNQSRGVFDVAAPGQIGSDPMFNQGTPGQSPVNDPAIKDMGFDKPANNGTAVPITINRSEPTIPPVVAPTAPAIAEDNMPSANHQPSGDPSPLFTSDSDSPMPPDSDDFGQVGKSRGKGKTILWTIVILILLAAGAYLVIDLKLIKTNINLPYHFFSQTDTKTTTSAQNDAAVVPSGFSHYQLSDAALQFNAPTAWGTPSFSSDPGFSKRGGTNKTNGTHAYQVAFSQNKNVTLTMTNGSLLAENKTASRYFDDLGWCLGTIDQQYYLNQLLYSSTDGVDTPATIVCSKGPLKNASKVDDSTIVITKAVSTEKTTLGDIYVKNLSGNSSGVVVFRAVDADMTNGNDIKTLLSGVRNL